jgi:hypothetical protein
MRYIVLYAETCHACSDVAQLVRSASVPGLEARGFADPEVTALLHDAGREVPHRPALLVVDNAGDVGLFGGWAMRRRLATVIGWRRSGTIMRLLAAEWRARLTASTPAGPSRRRLLSGALGGALAGVAGWAVSAGAASANPGKPTGASGPTLVEAATAQRVLATGTAQRAVRAWGPADAQVYLVRDGADATYVLFHPEREATTFIDAAPAAEPVGFSVGVDAEAGVLRFHTVDGAALLDVSVADGTVRLAATGDVEPDIATWQVACFFTCLGRKGGVTCVNACYSCATTPNAALRAIACAQCLTCAGPHWKVCLQECAII